MVAFDLNAFWRGDDRAIEAVYRQTVRALLGVARTVVGPAEAESTVHEVFVDLLRNEELRRKFTGGSVAAWLGAIARNKSLDLRRRTGRAVDDPATPDQRAEASPEPRLEARDFLLRFLNAGVPRQQVDFFRRRFIDGRTQIEIAAELKIPRSTLEGWEHRLSEKLRRFIWESSQ